MIFIFLDHFLFDMELNTLDKVLSVSQLIRRSRNILEKEIEPTWLEGEVSNCKAQNSGHLYFSLKDSNAQIRAVCFRYQSKIKCEIKDGMQIFVFGSVTLYEKAGTFQIIVEKIEPKGLGHLQQEYEKLKQKLQLEGLFNEDHKKNIPSYPQCIGVITSKTSAAIKDFLKILYLRFPCMKVILYHSNVQGSSASGDIISGINYFQKKSNVDVIVITRGGGSIEDLWCFNDENLARNVYASNIPIISAIGHEIDWTIIDYVCDFRAPTPSRAAEIVTMGFGELIDTLRLFKDTIEKLINKKLDLYHEKIKGMENHYILKEPINYIKQLWVRTDDLKNQIQKLIHLKYQIHQIRLGEYPSRIDRAFQVQINQLKSKIMGSMELIKALNPNGVLNRGYALAMDQSGKVIQDATQICIDDHIKIKFKKGSALSKVIKTFNNE